MRGRRTTPAAWRARSGCSGMRRVFRKRISRSGSAGSNRRPGHSTGLTRGRRAAIHIYCCDIAQRHEWSRSLSQAVIRKGREEDLPGLVEIYNYYVLNGHVTFDTELATV